MNASRPSPVTRWIRALVRLLPFDAQRQHGHEIEQVFLAQHDEARDGGWWPRARLWLSTAAGLLRVAPGEQWAATRADVRSAIRVWRSTPLLTLALIATTAGGIAAVTAAFSLVHGVVLKPLPIPDPSTLLRVQESHADAPGLSNLTYATFLDLSAGTGRLRVAASRWWFYNLSGQGDPERLTGSAVSGAFFEVLGVRAQLGRLLNESDDRAGHDRVVVLSDSLWRRRFGADAGVVGRFIRLDDTPHRVVGVLPPGAGFPLDAELWKPLLARDGGLADNRRSHMLQVIGRVRHDDLRAVDAELATRASAIALSDPGGDPGLAFTARPVLDPIVAPVRRPLVAVLVGAGLLLLVVCGNATHVLMARASAREREFMVRAVLGASRAQLARLLLTEGLALAAVAGAAGTLLAWGAIRALPSVLPPDLPRAANIALDLRTLAVATLVALFTGLAIAVTPAIGACGVSLSSTWRTRGIGRTRWLGMSPGTLLGVTQLLMAFVLVTGAILLIQSAALVLHLPLGFDTSRLLRVDLSLNRSRLPAEATGDDYLGVFDPILRRLEALPGVQAVGLTSTAPLAPGPSTGFEIAGKPEPGGREALADIRIVDPGLTRALGVPLRAGRSFEPGDTARSRPVMLVSETLVRQYFRGENPVGRFVTMRDWGPPLTGEIVGVVGDVIGTELESAPRPTIYWPYPQFPQLFTVTIFVRTGGDPAALAGAVRTSIWSLEPDQPLARVEPMTLAVRQARARRLALTGVLAGFAGLATAFALLGVFAILAHRAARQVQSFGVRVALGARPAQVAGLVLREAAVLGAAGVCLGALLAWSGARWMAGLLYGIPATDPVAFLGAALLVGGVALGAAAVPAWRVACVNPTEALRSE